MIKILLLIVIVGAVVYGSYRIGQAALESVRRWHRSRLSETERHRRSLMERKKVALGIIHDAEMKLRTQEGLKSGQIDQLRRNISHAEGVMLECNLELDELAVEENQKRMKELER